MVAKVSSSNVIVTPSIPVSATAIKVTILVGIDEHRAALITAVTFSKSIVTSCSTGSAIPSLTEHRGRDAGSQLHSRALRPAAAVLPSESTSETAIANRIGQSVAIGIARSNLANHSTLAAIFLDGVSASRPRLSARRCRVRTNTPEHPSITSQQSVGR